MTNEPAFPLEEPMKRHHGLTKLEYAAIEAMKGCCANLEYINWHTQSIARISILQAKELLEQLEAELKPKDI